MATLTIAQKAAIEEIKKQQQGAKGLAFVLSVELMKLVFAAPEIAEAVLQGLTCGMTIQAAAAELKGRAREGLSSYELEEALRDYYGLGQPLDDEQEEKL